jgi:competence protein ComEC
MKNNKPKGESSSACSPIPRINEIIRKPLVCGFILFLTGIIYAYYTQPNFTAFLSAVLFISGFLFLAERKLKFSFSILLIFLMFSAGALSYANFVVVPANDISRLSLPYGQNVYVKGVVKSMPVYKWQRWGNRKCSFLLRLSAYKKLDTWESMNGLSQVCIFHNKKEFNYNDTIIACCIVKKTCSRGSDFLQRLNYTRYLNRRGIYTLIDIKTDDDTAVVKKSHKFSFMRLIQALRRDIEQRFKRYLPVHQSAVLSAMIAGSRNSIPKELMELFVNTGTVHVLSVSGLHVGIIAGIVFLMLRLVGTERRLTAIIVIMTLFVYVFIAGQRAPVIRASIMIFAYLLSVIMERDFDIYSALSLAGFFILFICPGQAFEAGFQLSFLCVFFIVYLTPRLEAVIPFRMPFAVSKTVCSSIAVFIGIWPVVAYHFHIVSFVSIAANLLVVPLLGVILSLGLVFLILTYACHILALAVSGILNILFFILFNVIEVCSRLPFAHTNTVSIPLGFIMLYYCILFIVSEAVRVRNIMCTGKQDF